jgi:hypothetical protein
MHSLVFYVEQFICRSFEQLNIVWEIKQLACVLYSSKFEFEVLDT